MGVLPLFVIQGHRVADEYPVSHYRFDKRQARAVLDQLRHQETPWHYLRLIERRPDGDRVIRPKGG